MERKRIMVKRQIDKANYYRLFDELAALGRLRRLRLQREAGKGAQDQIKPDETQKEKKEQ